MNEAQDSAVCLVAIDELALRIHDRHVRLVVVSIKACSQRHADDE